MKTLLAGILTLTVLSVTAGAANTIAVGTPTTNQSGEVEVPVVLAVDVDLSCLSVVLTYPPDQLRVAKDGLRLLLARFPWEQRSVVFSVKPAEKQLVFTVADLVGQNTMVRAGSGAVFTVIGKPEGDSSPLRLGIVKATAFDKQGNKVALGTDGEGTPGK